ncbi:MAG: hypothetical protein J6O62_01310 [Bacilli bacterium]|nr:hypothetical protein [Bacilli bacterium]
MKKIGLLLITIIYCVTILVVFNSGVLKKYNLAASVNDVIYSKDEIDKRKISFTIKDTSLSKGQTEKITVNIAGNDNHNIKWTTSNSKVISLSKNSGKEIYITANTTGKSAQITVIVDGTKEKSIRITTRKKQEERYDINITGEKSQDVMYSWWTYPILINDGDNDFYGLTTSQGYIGVAKYDKSTKKTTQNYLAQSYDKGKPEIDDHNAPAVYKLPDNRILAAFSSGHAKDNKMHIRISTRPNDITEFGKDIVLQSNGTTTYSQILNKNNKYYLFHRCGGVNNWCYFSTSNPEKWTNNDKTFIKAPGQYYMKLVDTTVPDLVRFLITFNPSANVSDAGNIRMGFIDFKSGNVYDANYNGQKGTLLGSINDTFDYSDFSIVLEKEKGKLTRLFDAAVTEPGRLALAYCTWVPKKNGETYATYKVLKNNKKYTIVNNSYGFWSKYFGGISFIDEDEMVVSSGINNSVDTISIYKYDLKYDRISESRKIFRTYNNQNYRAIRPIVSYNLKNSGKVDIMWLYGKYNHDNYNNFDMKPFLANYKFTTNQVNASSNISSTQVYKNQVKTGDANKKTTTKTNKNKTNQVKKNNETIKDNTTPKDSSKTSTNKTTKNTTTNASTNNNTNTNKNNTTTQQQTKPSVPTISIKVENASRSLTAGQCNNNHLTFDVVDTSGANITKMEYKNSEHDYRVFHSSNLNCSGNRCNVRIRKMQKNMYIRVTNSRNQQQIIGKYTVCNIPMIVHNESTLKSGKCVKSMTFTVEDRSGAQISSLQYSNKTSNFGLHTTVSFNNSRTTATIIMKKSHNPIYFKARNSFGVEQVFGPYKICIK